MSATTTVRVRYGETDAMGWVYHATYLTYFEVGRTELIRKVWRSYRELEDEGLKLPVVQAGCRYFRGARYDDEIMIESRMTLPTPARIRFDYRIGRAADGVRLVEGFTEHCFVDERDKPIPVPADLIGRVMP
ncbi:MAG: thioesterase family protein [bacterium]|nr:thioesterase family protein [bacterium]